MFIARTSSNGAKLRRNGMCGLLALDHSTCRSYGAWCSFGSWFYNHAAPNGAWLFCFLNDFYKHVAPDGAWEAFHNSTVQGFTTDEP